jgi:hypothetical protein
VLELARRLDEPLFYLLTEISHSRLATPKIRNVIAIIYQLQPVLTNNEHVFDKKKKWKSRPYRVWCYWLHWRLGKYQYKTILVIAPI